MRDSEKDEPGGGITFSFHYWPELIWLKIKPAGLRSCCIHRWPHGPSVTSNATCFIQPVFIYVEIELLSAKLWVYSSLLVSGVSLFCCFLPTETQKPKQALHLHTHGSDCISDSTNTCVMYRYFSIDDRKSVRLDDLRKLFEQQYSVHI